MLEAIDIRKYLAEYGSSVNEDGSRILESVSCGGESGPKARICDYGWVLNTHIQCVEYGVPFHFHQTGARLRRSVPDGHGGHILKIYEIPREYQHTQAEKAGLDYGGGLRSLPAFQPTVFLYVKSQKKREAIKPGIHLIRYIIDGYFRSNI